MKISHELDKTRLYEVTEVAKDNAWYAEHTASYCILGTIIEPSKGGYFLVKKSGPSGFLSNAITSTQGIFLGHGITIRPLNKRDQEKIERRWNQLCPDPA